MSPFRMWCTALAAAIVLSTGVEAHAQTIAWTVTPEPSSTVQSGLFGTEFAPNADIAVSSLGWYDDTAASPDGLLVSHDVGIFEVATQTLVVSTTVPAGTTTTKINEFRFVPVTPVTLTAGTAYVIVGIADGDPARFVTPGGNMTVHPALTLGPWWDTLGQQTLAFPMNVQPALTVRLMGPNLLFDIVGLPDICARAEVISCNSTVNVDNTLATTDPMDPVFNCRIGGAVQGVGTVWYQFVATDSSALVSTCNTAAPATDTLVAVYSLGNPANPCGTLTEIGCDDDACGASGSAEVCVTGLTPGQTYYIQLATNPGSTVGGLTLDLHCPCMGNDDCATATLVAVPSVTSGSTATATADVAPTCSFVNDTAPGVWYQVIGTGNTMTASLCSGVTAYNSKLSVYCGGCASLSCVTANDNFCGLQSEVSWCSAAGESYLILVHGFGFDAGAFELALTDGAPCSPPDGSCGPPPPVMGACCTGMACTVDTQANCVAGGGSYQGDGTDCTGNPCAVQPANDMCAGAELIPCGGSATLDNTLATQDPTDPSFTCRQFGAGPGFRTVWYRFVATDTSALVSTCNTQPPLQNTLLAVYAVGNPADPCGSLVLPELGCSDNDCGATGYSEICLTGLNPAEEYFIQVATFTSNDQGTYALDLQCPCPGLPPANDACAGATPVAIPSTTPGSTANATVDAVAACDFINVTAPGVWYQVTGTGNIITASLCNGATAYNAKVSVYSGTCASLVCVAANDNFCGLQPEASWCSSVGLNYLLLVHGFGFDIGAFELVMSEAPPPAPVITASPGAAACEGTTVTLDAGSGFATYLWTPGGETTQTIHVTAAGTFGVTVTDVTGCQGSDSIAVTFSPNPTVTITATPGATVCDGTTVTLDAGPGFASYFWTPAGELTQTIQVVSSGTFSVNVVDTNGCPGADSITVTVNANPVPVIVATPGTEICPGDVITLDAGAGFSGYLWSPGGEVTQTIDVTTAGTYGVTVTDFNGCTGTAGVDIVPGLMCPPPGGCVCPGDMNGDGVTNGADLQTFVDCFLSAPMGGAPPAGCECVDADQNGIVDLADRDAMATILLAGSGCPPPGGCVCPGDMNGDGALNGADLQTFIDCFLSAPMGGAPPAGCECVDADQNGVVDLVDRDVFAALLLAGAGCLPPGACACPGDMNGDGALNGADLQVFVDCYIQSAPTGVPASGCQCVDADGNGSVDSTDIGAMVNALLSGTPCP
ncbi:MAG: hypothetical protein ACE5F9_05590 [Phycisphaerae bacterium]